MGTVQCGIGAYCKIGAEGEAPTCSRLNTFNATCSSDDECANHLVCSNKICVKIGGIENGGASDNALACKSGFVNDNKCFDTPTLKPKVLGGKNSYLCKDSYDTCTYTSTAPSKVDVQLKCQCGLSESGSAYCPNKFEPTFTENQLSVMKKFGMNCNAAIRFSIQQCYTKWAVMRQRGYREKNASQKEWQTLYDDLHLLHTYIVQKYERNQFSKLQDPAECVKKDGTTYLYYQSKAALEQFAKSKDGNALLFNENWHALPPKPFKYTKECLIAGGVILVLIIFYCCCCRSSKPAVKVEEGGFKPGAGKKDDAKEGDKIKNPFDLLKKDAFAEAKKDK